MKKEFIIMTFDNLSDAKKYYSKIRLNKSIKIEKSFFGTSFDVVVKVSTK